MSSRLEAISYLESINDRAVFYSGRQHGKHLDLLLHLSRYSNLLLTVVGPTASGKTHLKNRLKEQLDSGVRALNLDGRMLNQAPQFLAKLEDALDLEMPSRAETSDYLEAIRDYTGQLTEDGRSCLFLIDHAESLEQSALDIILDLATTVEDARRPHFALFGQESLLKALHDPINLPRFEAVGHHLPLEPFSEVEARSYLEHRCHSVGLDKLPLDDEEFEQVYLASLGWPGLLNGALIDALKNTKTEVPPPLNPLMDQADDTPHFSDHLQVHLTKKEGLDKAGLDDDDPFGLGSEPLLQEEDEPVREPSTPQKKQKKKKAAAVKGKRGAGPLNRTQLGILAGGALALALIVVGFLYTGDSGKDAPPEPSTALGLIERSQQLREGSAMEGLRTPEMRTPEESQAELARLEQEMARQSSLEQSFQPPAPPAAPPRAAEGLDTPATAVQPPPPRPAQPSPPATSNHPAHRESWLLQQNPEHFTLQLMASAEEATMTSFVNAQDNRQGFSYYRRNHASSPWVLVYGNYPNRVAAEEARANLPDALRGQQPWLRTFGSIQTDIRNR